MEQATTAVLAGEHLKKTFVSGSGKRQQVHRAVDDVSLSLKKGEALGLIGSSGCGKTTTLRMLLGLLKPDEGRVLRRGQIGFVGQDPYASLAPTWTVGKIIAEPLLFNDKKGAEKRKRLTSYEACREQVCRAMALVHLDPETYEHRLPSQLSGGERQRVSIARALILQPDFLVLDEPTSMLDEEVKGKITEVIQEIVGLGRFGVLLVTHDIAMAARICDRLMVMENGRIIEEGEASALFADPQKELTKNLIAVATDVKQYWARYREEM